MKKLNFSLIICLGFLLLTSMAWVRLNLLKPAEVTLPSHIRKILIIDRTLPLDAAKNRVEEVITGEVMKQDEQAVRRLMDGIIGACAGFNLYEVEKGTERLKGGAGKAIFSLPLEWNEVSQLCNKYASDALLVVEYFDSDFLVTNPVQIVKQAAEGALITGTGYQVNGIATVSYGVRLYDPLNRKITDEFQLSHRMNFNGGGYTVQDAVNYVLDKVDAINQTGFYSGQVYGERISPSYYTVTREFYNKPRKNEDLRMGVRKSEVADWNGAIECWTRALNAKRKIAGRAAFNIAVAYEVLGDLEKAKEWAAKSYTEYREKRGNDYFNALVYRQREESVIRRQLTEE